MEHSKGPWKLVKKVTQGQFGTEFQIRNEENYMIAEVGPNAQDANAALIAAAPEMLTTLLLLEKYIKLVGNKVNDTESALQVCQDAIKKARGEK